jgi:hypothetical protein
LCVDAVEALEPVGELLAQRLDHEVVVVRHQAERVDEPLVPDDDIRQEPEKEAAVGVVEEDRGSRHAAGTDVIDAVGEEVSGQARHGARVGAGDHSSRLAKACPRKKVTLSLH